MNSPNPDPHRNSPPLSWLLAAVMLLSSLIVILPALQAADSNQAPSLAHNHADHTHAVAQGAPGEASPVVVDFGNGPADAPIAGLDQWQAQNGLQSAALEADVTGPKKVMVLRVYFNDYPNASRFSKAEVEGMFSELDTLWRNTSYNKISIPYVVSELFQLPDNRSSYVDDFDTGDLSNGGKLMKVMNDAIDNSPAGLDWNDVEAVMVVMAETSATQFHRGQSPGKCNVKMGPDGDIKNVGCAIFSENPTETERQVWGRWAHEMGHAFQEGGPAHPSNYNSEFELMDSNYPGQTGIFEKQAHVGFPGWLPPAKYAEITPTQEGQTICLWAMEFDPAGKPNPQAVKAKVTDTLYYLVSVRRRVLGDDLNGQFPSGIPDEGVLIERVVEGASQWVEVKGKGGNRNNLWKEGDTYSDPIDGIYISVVKQVDADNYCVRVLYTGNANKPDVGLDPWTSPPGDTWETTDIWFDSPINGYGVFRYSSWNDLSGNPVPRGNGDDPAVGMVNRFYARVRNVGTANATDVVVNFEVTDPLGVGIAGANGWAPIGSVDKNSFPALASIAPGAFVDVYIEWTPNIELTEEQIAEGVFAFHSCVRVKLNPVAGETALGNQDGDREQENISYFQAAPAGDGGEPVYHDVIRLRNDDLVNEKFFYLDYESDLPAAWSLEINGGDMGVLVPAGEVSEIPVTIKPQGPAVVGSIFGVDVSASSQRELVSDLDAKDTHLEFTKLGGVRVEARVLERPKIECRAENHGEVVVTGRLTAENFDKYYDAKNPPMVLLQGVDENRDYILSRIGWRVVPVGPDGGFGGDLYSTQPLIKEVLCLFAGTDKLASASSSYVPVRNPTDPPAQCSELFSPTQIPAPGLINFDDLSEAAVIGTHYQAAYGVVLEDSPTTQAIIYNQSLHPTEPTEPHSLPNVAMNNAVHPNTSAGAPMLIRFDSPKTDVGLYMGNGEVAGAGPLVGLLSAYDSAGTLICQVRNQPVPEDAAEFIGIHDSAGRIASITLDYGNTPISEVIDDLYFAPHTPDGPTPTPTATITPTVTASPTPSPTPTNTPIGRNPVVVAPYFPVGKLTTLPIFGFDLAIHGIEITQGIQCFDTSKGLAGCADNSLPVTTKKDTTARIYLKYQHSLVAGGALNNVPMRLHIFANGVEYIANASGRATPNINQGVSDSADIYFNVNFSNDVPVTFYAEVDPNNAFNETNEGNNRYPASGTIALNFERQDTLKVVGQRLRYHPAGYAGEQYAQGWAVNGGAADWLEQVLPMRNNGINYTLAPGYLDWTGSLSGGDGQHDLIRYLNSSYVLQLILNAFFGVNGAYVGADHVYGWAPNAGYSGGHADMPVYPHAGGLGIVGIGTDRTSDGSNSTDDPGGGALIFGHELVHDYDVFHTDTADSCGSGDSNSNFPYGSSSIQEYGYNPITGKIYDPATTHDLMSYCPAFDSKQGWIAPFTWQTMFAKLSPGALAAAQAEATFGVFRQTDNGQSLVVNAKIFNPAAPNYDPNHPGELGDLYLLETGAQLNLPAGDYAVELRNGAEVLASHPFTVSFESEYSAHAGFDGHEEPGDPADLMQAGVSFIIPWVTGTTSVALVHDEVIFDERTISASAPAVTVTNPATPTEWPADSVQTLTWQGSDADGDALSYSVLFSADAGATWSVLASELVTPSLAIEVNGLAGAPAARFRVVATDGVNTGFGESAAVTIPNKAPIAQISDPVAGRTFIPGALVVLQGAALDLEDGRLGDDALHWSSDQQGDLGVGPSLPVNNLQPGPHTITLSVQDSQGAAASTTVKILIGYDLYLPNIRK